MTRDLSGELAPGRVARSDRHVEQCEGCRRERGAYAALDRALRLLPMSAPVPARLEQDTLRRVRVAASDGRPRPGRAAWWVGLGVPALAGAAVLVLAIRGAQVPADPSPPRAQPRADAPGPRIARRDVRPVPPAPQRAPRRRRAEPTVPSEPPPELAARPELFVNLPMLRNLEKLEHYDAIQTTTDDTQPGVPSNG